MGERLFESLAYHRGPGDIGAGAPPAIPAVVMVADVCRQELLFEMDAEVVVKQ